MDNESSLDHSCKREFRAETIEFFSRWLVSNLSRSMGVPPSPMEGRDKQISRWMEREIEAGEEADEEDNCTQEKEGK